jgi:glutamate:GABA antiporter
MESHSHGLRRELKLRDLVLMQVVLIFSLNWIGYAAKQGPTQLALWLFAIILFYIPLAAVVVKLSRAMPVEGGSYQWIKAGLSPFAGYMAAWSLTVFAVFYSASNGSVLANGFAWVGGAHGVWMATSKPFAMALTLGFCLIAYFVNVRGLHLVKWMSNASSILWFVIALALLFLLLKAWIAVSTLARGAWTFAWPGFSILTVIVLAKMSIGALGGFDTSAVFAEECRKPENDVGRSVLIAAPLIALMYVLGTAALLSYNSPADIDLAAPVQQAMHSGFGAGSGATVFTGIAVATFSIAFISSQIVFLGMVARLPMVAGWDGLLPEWWSELHPVYRTPSKAIAAVMTAVLLMGVLSLWGAGNQEAVQVTSAVGVASLCLMYLLLFGVVLSGFRSRPDRPGAGIRLGALTGLVVALVSLIFQIVPIGDVASPAIFAVKVSLLICLTSGLGAFLYWRGSARVRSLVGSQAVSDRL